MEKQKAQKCSNCRKLERDFNAIIREKNQELERRERAREREDQARQGHLDAARLEQQHIQHDLTQSLKRAQDDCVRLQSQLGESQRRIRDLEDLLRNAEHRIAAGIATLAVGPKNST